MRHLIHVGYPKAGSKFLQSWFARHPQLAFADGGLSGFADVYGLERAAAVPTAGCLYAVTSCEGLSAPRADAGSDLVSYDPGALPLAERQQRACRMLADLFPEATILIVTRGFRSMLLSSYSQYVRSGGDSDFADLVAHALSHRGGDGHHLVTVEHWNYDRFLAAYREAFGAGQVLVLPYELLRDDPGRFVALLEERLGLDPFEMPLERLNPTLSGEEMAWYPRFARALRKLGSRRLFALYVRAAFSNRLRRPIRLAQRIRPARPVTAGLLPDEVVEGFRGCAETLRSDPLYAPYAADYLL